MSVVMTALRRVCKVAAGVAPAALAAGLGPPALGVLLSLAILVVGAACWVLRSDARTERVSRVLLAWRGNASCLPSGSGTAPFPPVPRPRRRFLPRRS